MVLLLLLLLLLRRHSIAHREELPYHGFFEPVYLFFAPAPPPPRPPSPYPSNSNKFRSLLIWASCCWILAFAADISNIKYGVETGGGAGGGGGGAKRTCAQREQKLGHKKRLLYGAFTAAVCPPDRWPTPQKHCLQES